MDVKPENKSKDRNQNRNTVSHWTDCWTMGELGDLDRPSFSEWIRHLAGGDANGKARAASAAA